MLTKLSSADHWTANPASLFSRNPFSGVLLEFDGANLQPPIQHKLTPEWVCISFISFFGVFGKRFVHAFLALDHLLFGFSIQKSVHLGPYLSDRNFHPPGMRWSQRMQELPEAPNSGLGMTDEWVTSTRKTKSFIGSRPCGASAVYTVSLRLACSAPECVGAGSCAPIERWVSRMMNLPNRSRSRWASRWSLPSLEYGFNLSWKGDQPDREGTWCH